MYSAITEILASNTKKREAIAVEKQNISEKMVYIPPFIALYKTFLFNLRLYPIFCLYTSAYTSIYALQYFFIVSKYPFPENGKQFFPF